MGISKAKGMIFANRLQGHHHRLFVILGDGEMQEGQIAEALSPHVQPSGWMSELMVIVDQNYAQGNGLVWNTRIPPRPGTFDKYGWRELAGTIDGHDFSGTNGLAQLHTHFLDLPTAITCSTIKGKGVSFMENNPAWHSRTPNQEEYEAALGELLDRLGRVDVWPVPHTWPAPMQPEPLIAAYGQALLDAAEAHPQLVVLDADLTKEHGLVAFKERYPNRFFQCGIAEQDMVGIASGMALRGLLPVVHSHAAFLTRRALDQVHNQTTERTKVIYVGGSAGKLQPNGNGKSHETLIDGTTMALLGMPVYEPHAPEEVAHCLARCIEGRGSSYLRLLKQPGLREDRSAE